jgi:hypothetical protein
MKKNILFALFFFLNLNLILNFASCNTTDPKLEPDLKLELKDVSCTEAWLQLTTNNIQLPATINVLKNSSVAQTFSLSTQDSLLYIDSLLPNQNYKFKVVANTTNNPQPTTNEVLAQTMDTTAHNFTWQTFTFGEHSSSVLYDVAIINENDIWAVGEIYMNDSLGNPDPTCYNAVHWNGQSWKLRKIKTNACGGVDYPPIKAIYSFSTNDILFAHIDGSISYYNGIEFTNDCSLITQLNGSVNKIWGTSKNDFYVVSGNGFIAHYQNGNWTKIESNTNLPIRDIYGVKGNFEDEYEILCVADSYNSNEGSKIISIANNSTKTIWNDGRPYGLVSVWFIPDRKYFAVGDGLWESQIPATNWVKNNSFPTLYKNHIRGQSFNDIFVCGSYWLLAHYNGYTWQTYFPLNSGSFTSAKIKENTIIGVGGSSSKAIVVIGKR